MKFSKFLWILVFLLLAIEPTRAAGGGDEPTVTVEGLMISEAEPYQLVFLESAASFAALIESYLAGGGDTAKIGGFTFIPNRFQLVNGNRQPLDASAPSDPDVGDPAPVAYGTYGYRVFLTYWEESNLPGGRKISFYGLSNPIAAFESELLEPSDQYFVLDDPVPATFPAPDDHDLLSSVAEFELSYLPIEDYYYLAENRSYYPEAQAATISQSDRQLVIQRAIVAQTFDVSTNESDRIFQYRTLSFRPYPYPEWSVNEEAVIAFKYGYYCPPYWGPQLADNAVTTVDDGFMFFQTTGGGPEETTKTDSLLLSLSMMIGGQLTSRETIVENFGSERPDAFRDIVARYWWLVIILLIAGIAIGRATKPGVANLTDNQ